MAMKILEVEAREENFESVRTFLKEELYSKKVTKNVFNSRMLIFEEMFLKICELISSDETVTVFVKHGLSGITVNLEFYGDRFLIDYDNLDDFAPETAILREYRDAVSYKYIRRVNTVTIVFLKQHNNSARICMTALLLAIPVYAVLLLIFSKQQLFQFADIYLQSAILLFRKAILMISAPVTFFSIIKNITDCAVGYDRRIRISKLVISMVLSSVVAIALGMGVYEIVLKIMQDDLSKINLIESAAAAKQLSYFEQTVLKGFSDLIPADIFDAFSIMMPIPLILLAFLNAAAMCVSDVHFDTLKKFSDTVDSLMCKMLSIIMMVLPVAAFLSMLMILCSSSYSSLPSAALVFIIISVAVFIRIFLYAINLWRYKIPAFKFFKQCMPVLKDILAVDSTIDSIPNTKRSLHRMFGIKNEILEYELSFLGNLNLDGNCLILTVSSLLFMGMGNVAVTPFQMLLLGGLVLSLSTGAPNQPGSLVIGLSIIFYFFGTPEYYFCCAVLIEVVCGHLLLIVNSLGDLVIAAVDGKKNGCFKMKKA